METARRCFTRANGIIAGYLKDGFPAELVEAAKRQEATAAELQKNSVSGLAMAWSQAVAIEGKNSPDDDLKAIERVTAADVNRVARQYLDLDTRRHGDSHTAAIGPARLVRAGGRPRVSCAKGDHSRRASSVGRE